MEKNQKPRLSNSNYLILTAVNIGAALEWYEIGIFIAWQSIIQKTSINFDVIATSFNVGAVLLMVATIFATGGARALGGWFFGEKGDLLGRKTAFSLTILIATIPSWSLVLLSFFLSYDQWMTYSLVILTIIKFFQGMPAGGEIPGAICYLTEANKQNHNPSFWNHERYMCSYTLVGPQIGLALSSIVCLILKNTFSIDILLTHGWRIVFAMSGLLGLGGFLLRRKLHETAAFIKNKAHHKISYSPIKKVFSKYKKQLLFGFLIPILEIISFSVISFLPLYYNKNPFNLNLDEITLMSLGFYLLCIIFLPLIGYFSAKYQKFPWLHSSAWSIIPISILLFVCLSKGSFWPALVLNIILVFLFSVQASILPSLLANLFPVEVRYTGIAFSFNISDGILWTLATGLSFWFLSHNNPIFIVFIPISALIFLFIYRLFKKEIPIISEYS